MKEKRYFCDYWHSKADSMKREMLIFIPSLILIMFIGRIISIFLCKCCNCGHSVMTQYGSLYDYCPKCGKKVKIEDK